MPVEVISSQGPGYQSAPAMGARMLPAQFLTPAIFSLMRKMLVLAVM